MRQTGIVTAVEEKTAMVLIQRHSSCGSCNACKMGQEDAKLEIRGTNEVNAKVGQWVSVDMKDQDVLTAAFMVYVIPLLALLVGIVGGSFIVSTLGVNTYKDLFAALIGFLTMSLSFIALKKRENKLKMDKRFLSVITEVLDDDKNCNS